MIFCGIPNIPGTEISSVWLMILLVAILLFLLSIWKRSKRKQKIIFAGLGIYASTPRYARAAAKTGQIGVVSGAAFHYIFARILQRGDPDGHYRRAIKAFPNQNIAKKVLKQYFVSEGISAKARYKHVEFFTLFPSLDLINLIILANFCQVWLAKEGHNGAIGVNFLEKMQMPLIYAIYGVLLAKVDYIFVGAGIPMQISGILDKLIKHESATYNIDVEGMEEKFPLTFDPQQHMNCQLPILRRAKFFPIISLSSLARSMTRRPGHGIDGFIVENYLAGGHSANPRKKDSFTEDGEPLYGAKDDPNFAKMIKIGLPFYIAGAFSSPDKLIEALKLGAIGIQVGSIGALAEESGFDPDLRNLTRKLAYNGELIVYCSAVASPTGFSFKTARVPGTLTDIEIYEMRERICDIGALLVPYFKGGEGKSRFGYRCSAEPIKSFCKKGGNFKDTDCTMCLCNGLFGAVDFGQRLSDGTTEPAVITYGKDYSFIRHLMSHENDKYFIKDASKWLLSKYLSIRYIFKY